jgi:hypothetical protein
MVEFATPASERCIDVRHTDVLARLARRHPDIAQQIGDDTGAITREQLRTTRNRLLTRPLGETLVHEFVDPIDQCIGIHYLSRFDKDESCWALATKPGKPCSTLELVDDPHAIDTTGPTVAAAKAIAKNGT